ncbi:MAG: GAF domain-containing protein, partial [Spirochaetales bacterium]|nr:GAF domain-containing protein [Spirochaetales bacterium]
GLASLLISAAVIAFPLPAVLQLFDPGTWGPAYWQQLLRTAPVPLAATMVAAYLLGLIRDSQAAELSRARERLRQFARDKGNLTRRVRLLEAVGGELERRVSGQQDSTTALYSELQKLYSLNLQKALETVLDTVGRFSGSSSSSIWALEDSGRTLRLAAARGLDTATAAVAIPVEGSIEGWVVRNNLPFSVRMLMQYENLHKLDTGRNIMTFPVAAGRKVWGVLNIEAMPFLNYNLHTEKLLQLILALCAPALERALEYEAVVRQAEANPVTGLPSFTELFSLLEAGLQRARSEGGTLSVILLEVANFEHLSRGLDERSVTGLLRPIADQLAELSGRRGSVFHYKQASQLALLVPDLDYDGASLLSLEILGMISERDWVLQEQPVQLEVILGYASLTDKEPDAESLLQVAENILEMQKL